jgi:transcriptional regulator with XRE-family HTH domain
MIHERYIKPISAAPVIVRLTEVRLAWGLSIREVAARIGCDEETLGKYERGKIFPKGRYLVKWAEVLGYELSIWPKKMEQTA